MAKTEKKSKKKETRIKKTKKEKSATKPRKFEIAKKIAEKPAVKPTRYFEAVGRRKTAVARVRLFTRRVAKVIPEGETPEPGEKSFLINEKPLDLYFPTLELRQIVESPLEKMKCLDKFTVVVKVRGGGFRAQSEATRHGIARALVLFNADFRKRLKRVGFLTRDPRMRERKKFGLKRARRAPQWQKR